MDTLYVKLMDTKIQPFLNSLDIFAESIFENFVELATFMTINASFESPVYTPPRGSQNSMKVPDVRASNGSARTLNAQNILDLKRTQSIRFSKENSLLN